VDPDARRGRHGDWFEGYLVDISMDADSEPITQINVLPASGDEAADAVELIRDTKATTANNPNKDDSPNKTEIPKPLVFKGSPPDPAVFATAGLPDLLSGDLRSAVCAGSGGAR
jgi:hypothetical protein